MRRTDASHGLVDYDHGLILSRSGNRCLHLFNRVVQHSLGGIQVIRASKKIPYAQTTVAPERTQAQIQRLLYDYGVEGVQWTTVRTQLGEQLELKFVVRDQKGSAYTARVRPPTIIQHRREEEFRQAASLRLMYHWLKSKLEAISFGLVSFEEEFLSNIAGKLPSGQEVTVGDLLIPKLAGLDMTDFARALPEKSHHATD